MNLQLDVRRLKEAARARPIRAVSEQPLQRAGYPLGPISG